MEDGNIVDLFWNRSDRAIVETSNKYGNYLFTISFNILKSREDSEECVNDTYLKTWNSIPPNRPAKLKGFLGKITRNLSLDVYRKNRSIKRGSGEVELAIEELSNLIPENSLQEALDEKYLVEKINEFLESIDIDKRKIFVMRYFYINSIKEISQQTKIKENTISTILLRLRTDLRKFLEEGGIEI